MQFNITQPLLQNYKIDNLRATLEASRKDREAADIQLQSTDRLDHAQREERYWDLAYNIDNLKAQQQSLDLASGSWRTTRSASRLERWRRSTSSRHSRKWPGTKKA